VKAKTVVDSDGKFYGIRFNCPGCLWEHDGHPQGVVLPVSWLPHGQVESPHVAAWPHWGFNGDMERPTLTPSVLSTSGCEPGCTRHQPGDCMPKRVCHSFVTAGRIQFLGDCTHALAGQTVDLPDIEHE
jgi:hypothetical protein